MHSHLIFILLNGTKKVETLLIIERWYDSHIEKDGIDIERDQEDISLNRKRWYRKSYEIAFCREIEHRNA